MIILDLNGSKAKKCYHNFSGQEHLYVVYKRVYRPAPLPGWGSRAHPFLNPPFS